MTFYLFKRKIYDQKYFKIKNISPANIIHNVYILVATMIGFESSLPGLESQLCHFTLCE